MARSLTAQEEALAHQMWPRINTAHVVVTDNATPRYNCLAWTLGITTSWIWPWGQRNATKAEFDAFYLSQGYSPAGSGEIAVFGLSLIEMTHGTVSGPGHGSRWESKCGAWLRIQHGLAEMEGGTLYGNVLGFYGPAAPVIAHTQRASRLSKMMKTEILTKKERQFLNDRARQVDPQLRERFEQAYQRWKQVWNHPFLAISSNPATRTHAPEFLELVSLGPEILPLLIQKLADPEEFFALQAVDRLGRPEFVITPRIDAPAVLLGEQGRAVETVKQWIRREA